jgi:hypothetical protein
VTLVPKTGLLPFLHRFPYYTTRNASWYQNGVGATVITLAQLRVPPQMRGRVMSLNTLLIMGVRPLGDFPASGLIALIGGPLTVIISALLVGSYSLYLVIGRPVIRRL